MAYKKTDRREKIRKGIRASITGTGSRPRLSVFRSNKDIYAQVIDDVTGKTLAAASSRKLADKVAKSEKAGMVGKMIAEAAKAKGVEQVVFDRGGYLYHGRVKNLAEGAREGGLVF